MNTECAGASPADGTVTPVDLQAEALLHAGKCRTWAARTFNDAPDAALCVGAGDRLLYAAQLLNLMAAFARGSVQAAEELERWRWLKEDATAEQWKRACHALDAAAEIDAMRRGA